VSTSAALVAWAVTLGVLGAVVPSEAEARGSRVQYMGVVNLNEASQDELDRLPGVGQRAAERILAHRQKRPFQRIEELVRVKGFGKKKFEKIKPFLTLKGPTTLKQERSPPSDSPKGKSKR
jgi:competence protein ComEA